jgi:hypothetical protein
MEAVLIVCALACPVGMLAMMGGMAWMARRGGSKEANAAGPSTTDAREASHA